MNVGRIGTHIILSCLVALSVVALSVHPVGAAAVDNGIVSPAADAMVAGVIQVQGVAQHSDFRKWQLDLLINGDRQRIRFIAVGDKMHGTPNTLANLDTTRYPNGHHILRLRVVYTGLNYDEYFTPITIDNHGAMPNTPTAKQKALEPVVKAEVLIAPDGMLGAGVPDGRHRVEVDLSDQTLTAWQGETVVLKTQVSTGKPGWPTVTGTFHVYIKLPRAHMIGPDYNTPDVPWTMYYFRGFALHGAYWHNNFGRPVSHGCVNMRVEEAKLLFAWADMGMEVVVKG